MYVIDGEVPLDINAVHIEKDIIGYVVHGAIPGKIRLHLLVRSATTQDDAQSKLEATLLDAGYTLKIGIRKRRTSTYFPMHSARMVGSLGK